MRVWRALAEAIEAGGRAALVTVLATRGSAPRDAGARLVVRPDGRFSGTIGGGTLEWRAIAEATAALVKAGPPRGTRRSFALGPELGQCCGGRVELLLETFAEADREAVAGLAAREAAGPFVTTGVFDGDGRLARTVVDDEGTTADFDAGVPFPPLPGGGTPRAARQGGARQSDADAPLLAPGRQGGRAPSDPASPGHLPHEGGGGRALSTFPDGTVREFFGDPRRPLYLFGAGHVGRALVMALAPLPFAVTWVDARPETFPRYVPENVALSAEGDPDTVLGGAPAGAFVLAMTHSHPLDLAVVAAALKAGRFPYVGVIGSTTKRARFESQLRAAGHAEAAIAALVCPIGAAGELTSKEPAAIAAMTAAELLLADQAARSALERPDPALPTHAARGPRRTRR